jgi:hypothetical protein
VVAHNLENFKNNTTGVLDDLTPKDAEFSDLDLE